jgi:hypothetical protein
MVRHAGFQLPYVLRRFIVKGRNDAQVAEHKATTRNNAKKGGSTPRRLTAESSCSSTVREIELISDDEGWMVSSRSAGNGGSCVEARRHDGVIEVRNSKNRAAGTVVFTTEEWDSFLFGAKRGEFDVLLAD